MHAITRLVPLILFAGALSACEDVSVDVTGGGTPPAGVLQGTVSYVGPPPCSQNGHVFGNAVVLVFDAKNPPPPAGLGNTAVNFGVVAGDVLFRDYPVTQGATKICPSASDANVNVSATYTISPMSAGQYVVQGFFDYTGDFFATFKFRDLPEATDIGGGYLDITDATKQVPGILPPVTLADGGTFYPLAPNQSDPNYQPLFLPVNIGTPGPVPSTSIRGVPSFTMPENGYFAGNVTVTLATKLPLSRPYFYPEGVNTSSLTAGGVQPTISNIVYNGMSSVRPPSDAATAKTNATPQNPTGNPDFVPVVTFPQDTLIYAQPSVKGAALGGAAVLDQYQGALPSLVLHAGVPAPEQNVGADIGSVGNPFHMQLGIGAVSPYVPAPGGNGGLFVWWNAQRCNSSIPGCQTTQLDYIPEQPGQVYRMWPLIVLAKLDDLPSGTKGQPNPNDPNGLIPQGTDLLKPAIIVQGITLYQDTVVHTTNVNLGAASIDPPLPYPDPSNLVDHVSVLLRPSTVCLDPRAPDHGGVVIVPGNIGTDGTVGGNYPPADKLDTGLGTVVDSARLTNPQLAGIVNHSLAGSTNGLMGGCLPTGRYQVNMVYPTGQAWTTPNEEGSCAPAEGATTFNGAFADDPLHITCATKPRPVLYSQGTRAIVEITPAQSAATCAGFSPTQKAPVGLDGKPIADGSPFACNGLCPDPSLDPTALDPKTGIPCVACLDSTLDPSTSPPCTTRLSHPPVKADAGQ